MKGLRNKFDYEDSAQDDSLPIYPKAYHKKLKKSNNKIHENLINLKLKTPIFDQKQLQKHREGSFKVRVQSTFFNKNTQQTTSKIMQYGQSIKHSSHQEKIHQPLQQNIRDNAISTIIMQENEKKRFKEKILKIIDAKRQNGSIASNYTKVQEKDENEHLLEQEQMFQLSEGFTLSQGQQQLKKNKKMQEGTQKLKTKRCVREGLIKKCTIVNKSSELKLGSTNRVLLSKFLLNKIKQKFEQHNINRCHRRLQQIAYQVNLSTRFIYGLWYEWQVDPTMKRRIMLNYDKIGNHRDKLIQNRFVAIKQILTHNPHLKIAEITNMLNKNEKWEKSQEHKPQVKTDAVYRYVKELGYVKKKINFISNNRNNVEYLNMRQEYASNFKLLVSKGASIYYFYWQALNIYMNRNQVWMLSDTGDGFIEPHGQNVLLFVMVSPQGYITYQTEYGCFSQDVLTTYLTQICAKASYRDQSKLKYVVLEHRSLYQSQSFQQHMNTIHFTLLFFPPFSTLLNPLTTWFQEVKHRLPKCDFFNQDHLLQELKTVMEYYNQKSISKFIKNVNTYLNICLAKQAL